MILENAFPKKKFYVYLDKTLDLNQVFYVGKGNLTRVNFPVRNKFHSCIVNKHGFYRQVVAATDDELIAFDIERKLIAEHKTYHHHNSSGANFTFGGDGSSGAVRPEHAKQRTSKRVLQYSLDEDTLLAEFSSIRDAQRITKVKNICRACQGHLSSAGGFVWKYADGVVPETRTVQTCMNMSIASNKKEVYMFALSGELLQKFSSVKEAAVNMNVNYSNIVRAAITPGAVAFGHLWSYHDICLVKPKKRGKSVALLNEDGTICKQYPTLINAATDLGIHHTNISGVLCGSRKHARGLRFVYV